MLWDRNPKHWKLFVFYYNPDESRLVVAKRHGSPLTLHYAKPAAWVITAAPIAIWIALAILDNTHFLR